MVMERAATQDNARSARLMRAGLNLIQQAISIYDSDLRLAVCNRRFAEMFDLPDTLVTPGAGFAETIRFLAERGEYGDSDDIDAMVHERVEQAKTFVPHYFERQRANGTTISVEGHPLQQGGWVSVYTDITEIHQQESLLRAKSEELHGQLIENAQRLTRLNRQLASTIAALEETKQELTDSEQRTRTTTEMMPAHIAHITPDETYSYSNRRLPSVLPGRPAEVVGLTVRDALGDVAYQAIKDSLHNALKGSPAVTEFSDPDTGARLRAAFTPDRDTAGGLQGAYVLSTDITQEAQARAALAQTHRRELAAQITRGLAHDFSNLLTIILGLQGRLERTPDLPAEALEMIRTTRAAAMRGGAILERLSNVAGPRHLHPSATEIASVFDDVRAMAAPSLPGQITLSAQINGVDGPVSLDRGNLLDALLNLILNARDAIAGGQAEGEGSGSIDISAQPLQGTWLEITVDDSGPGFSAAGLERALEPFYSTKGNDSGSGLGLPMVYDFAQLSGGHVTIGNRDGGGGRVRLRLPLTYTQAPADPMLVLLVEDNPDLRQGIREMLRDLGHSVLEANSVEEATMLAQVPGIGAVLTDISLGSDRTGIDLASDLAAQTDSPPVYLMTSLPPDQEDFRKAANSFPVLRKPFTGAELGSFLMTGRT